MRCFETVLHSLSSFSFFFLGHLVVAGCGLLLNKLLTVGPNLVVIHVCADVLVLRVCADQALQCPDVSLLHGHAHLKLPRTHTEHRIVNGGQILR